MSFFWALVLYKDWFFGIFYIGDIGLSVREEFPILQPAGELKFALKRVFAKFLYFV